MAGATACAAGPKHLGPLPDAASPQPRGSLAAETGARAQRQCRSGDTAVARTTNTWIRRTLHGSTRPAARCSPGSGSLSVAWASSDALLAALCHCDWGACTAVARSWRRRGAGTVEDGLRQVAKLGTLSAHCVLVRGVSPRFRTRTRSTSMKLLTNSSQIAVCAISLLALKFH